MLGSELMPLWCNGLAHSATDVVVRVRILTEVQKWRGDRAADRATLER